MLLKFYREFWNYQLGNAARPRFQSRRSGRLVVYYISRVIATMYISTDLRKNGNYSFMRYWDAYPTSPEKGKVNKQKPELPTVSRCAHFRIPMCFSTRWVVRSKSSHVFRGYGLRTEYLRVDVLRIKSCCYAFIVGNLFLKLFCKGLLWIKITNWVQ